MKKNDKHHRQQQAKVLINQVNGYCNRCDQPLPSMATILHGEVDCSVVEKSVLIGHFTDSKNIKKGTGRAIGESLEFILSDLPALGIEQALAQLDPHPNSKRNYLWGLKGYAQRHSTKALQTYAKFNHITQAVSGHLDVEDDLPVLYLKWHDVLKDIEVTQTTITCGDERHNKHSDLVLNAIIWILQQLDITLDDNETHLLSEYLIEEELDYYIGIMHELDDKPWSALTTKSRPSIQQARLPSMAFLLMELEAEGNDSFNRVKQRYEWLEAQWNSHTWLLVLQAKKYQESDDYDIDNTSAQVLLRAFKKNPGNIRVLHTIIDLLLCAEHYAQALSVAMELLKSQPHQFENWWSASYALSDMAWDYRGHDYWDNVEERNQSIFITISDMAERALNVAIQIQPYCPPLIEAKIRLLQGACEELRSLLKLSIKVDASFEDSYDAALNFTQPRWGGWLEEQMTIVRLAYKHNPQEKWPLELYKDYVESNPDYKLSTRLKLMFKRFTDKNWPNSVLETSDDQ